MPPGLIKDEDGMCAWRYCGGDLGKVQVHRLDVAGGQDEGRTLALPGADGAEDIGGRGALVAWREWPCAASCPASRDLVLLADAGLIGEPDLYVLRANAFCPGDFAQTGGQTFLKSSMAPAA